MTAHNHNDSILLAPTLQTVANRGLPPDIETLHLDRGYDSALTITRGTDLGVTDVVCAMSRQIPDNRTPDPPTRARS